MTSPMIGVWFLVVTLSLLAFAKRFRDKQNKTDGTAPTGGPISIPKALWLGYTIHTWFLWPLPLLFVSDLGGLRPALIVHLLSWWIRGPLELVMIYRWFNWTPVYGITHDIVHILVVAYLTFSAVPAAGAGTPELLAFVYLAGIVFFVTAEALFAFLFLAERGRKDSLIYFADDTPRYRRINRLTATIVTIGFLHMAYQIGIAFGVVS